jgi:hypothetical protein
MLAGSIADSKLLQITTAGKVATSALTGTLFTLGTTAAALSTVSTIAGMVSITSTSFVALTGNASTATALAAGRTISGTGEAVYYRCFDGTGNVSGAVTLLNSAVISKVLTGFRSRCCSCYRFYLSCNTKIKREYSLKWMQ